MLFCWKSLAVCFDCITYLLWSNKTTLEGYIIIVIKLDGVSISCLFVFSLFLPNKSSLLWTRNMSQQRQQHHWKLEIINTACISRITQITSQLKIHWCPHGMWKPLLSLQQSKYRVTELWQEMLCNCFFFLNKCRTGLIFLLLLLSCCNIKIAIWFCNHLQFQVVLLDHGII